MTGETLRKRRGTWVVVLFMAWGVQTGYALAKSKAVDLCNHAAQVVAVESGVPLAVLKAITATETGRQIEGRLRPWPWTVNMEGKGVWFDEPDSARAYVYKHFKSGARSFDVGCFQINYRWHGSAFASIEEMFDPLANARYAARFLKELYGEFGDWSKAAGAYHSRTEVYAARYRKRFDALHNQYAAVPEDVNLMQTRATPESRMRNNSFPLLQQIGPGRPLGSLVPIAPRGQALFLQAEG